MPKRTDNPFETMLIGILAVLLAIPFLADILLPLGTAIWVIYIFPVTLAYLTRRPVLPPVVAAVATVLMITGFYLGPPGVEPWVALTNRILGAFTAWIVGGIGFYFVRTRRSIRQEEWLQSGQVGLAERMSGEQSLTDLADNVLGFLSHYSRAQAGVLYIRDGDLFRKSAAVGVPAGAQIPDVIDAKDGLLGRVIVDRQGLALDDVPDDYLYFGSGLGQGKPRFLLASPVSADDMVMGVVELGFVNSPPALCGELLNRAAESIGVAIRSARYRLRLQELLEETRQQAVELQTQSEELRAANEELEQQSRSLLESQSQLEEQQVELEQTNAQLEGQAEALELQRDNLSRAQTELKAQARDLEQASRYKSEFLANMSHELRTPLNSLLIMARLLADNRHGNLSADQVKHAETIETSGNDLLLLINDILDISKIEAGRLELQTRRMRLAPLMDKLRDSFAPGAAQKGLTLIVESAADVPADMETDPHRLEQVLKNFLSNAIKFTAQGEVRLSIAAAEDDRIAFRVRDSGIGITAEQQEAIFEPFRQADGTISRHYGGTGLGLSISRELARLLGGEIRLDSTPGQGSLFSLVIPRIYDPAAAQAAGDPAERSPARASLPAGSPPSAPVERPAPRPPMIEDDRQHLSGDMRTILCVEDDPAFARILCDLAREMGFQCLITDTADEGVLMARQYLPHAIILDMSLPDHTGLSVLDRLKRDTRTRHIPIHVVSASDYMHAALSYGAVGYMLKPVKREELARLLEGLETRFAQKMRRVLVVEDDATQRESLRLLLASREVETIDACSASECFSRLANETFDCMVLDLNLPDASGFDVLEQLSIDETLSFPPVIVYTGRDLSSDEELRLRKYSKSIIIKGAKSPDRLLDEVTLFLHQVVSELPKRQQQMLEASLNRDVLLEGRHILVVEDDIRNIYALTSLFEPHGVVVELARNGLEAIRALEAHGEDNPVDLVLMDVMMPQMDGLTATREIRGRPQWRDLPIIMLTAKAMPQDQEQCIQAGANDYLAKPLDVDKLLSLVRVWMPR
ncbi:MAG: response regulator [Sphingobium sp.]